MEFPLLQFMCFETFDNGYDDSEYWDYLYDNYEDYDYYHHNHDNYHDDYSYYYNRF